MLEAAVGILGTMIMAIFGWAFNLNSRIGVAERAHEELKNLISVKFDALDEKMDIKFDAQEKRLDRIERSMNGHLQRD